ncbi:MAG TPA: TadE/TadG family type IV pilus assembly protein [Phenylobacterium sp.]|jgi:Flp pilus assembly protein TadG
MLMRFRKNESGVAAVEFALVAPVLILLYCGLAELTMAMMAERQAAHSASVVGDLVAQSINMNATQMTDIFHVGDAIMKPFSTATLKIRVSSVKADANGVAKVVWSQGHGLGAFTAGATVAAFPANLLLPGDSVIEADVSYDFTSPIMQVVPNALNYSDSFYLKPRRVTEVPFT